MGAGLVALSANAARGAACEVRQDDAGLRGAYLGAYILSPARADGLVQVQYALLYESVHKDTLLTEWLKPRDSDALRPKPPAPPEGFHAGLTQGDLVDVWFDAGWWPAAVVALVGAGAIELTSEVYPTLRRTFAVTKVRPRWRWVGNAWQVSKDKVADK